MERTASATGLPCAASTSIWRSLATISSGVCAFFRPIHDPPSASAGHITGGPLLGGQVNGREAERQEPAGSGQAAFGGLPSRSRPSLFIGRTAEFDRGCVKTRSSSLGTHD